MSQLRIPGPASGTTGEKMPSAAASGKYARPLSVQRSVLALRVEAWVTQTLRFWSEEEEPTTEMEKG